MPSAELVRLALRQGRAAVLGWSAAWLALVSLYVASWPAVRDNGETYDEILADLPGAMQGLLGDLSEPGAFSTAEGYLTAELLAVTGPLLVVAMGLLVGSRAVAHDEESGPLELLLAQPVTRVRLLLSRALAAALEVAAVLGAALVALLLLGPVVDLGLGSAPLLRAVVVLGLLALEALCLGLLAGALTGRVGRARAWGGALALAAFLLHALGPTVPGLGWGDAVSPFGTVLSSDPFRTALQVRPVLALLLPSAAMLALACAAFRRRDLRLG